MTTAQQPEALRAGWIALTEDDRARAFQRLDGGVEGFLKLWGWTHFAKVIEQMCRDKNGAEHTSAVVAALRDCVAVMERDLKGLAVIQPELERAKAALATHAGADGWVKVSERLPEPGKPVLLDIGERHPVRAMYATKHSLQADPEMDEDCCDYSEEHDEYYAPEGWYEWNSEGETLWRMHNPVRWHEMPAFPAPPAPEALEVP